MSNSNIPPKIPASQAWQQMQQILDKELPVVAGNKRRVIWLWITAATIIGAVVLWQTNHSKVAVNNAHVNTVATNTTSATDLLRKDNTVNSNDAARSQSSSTNDVNTTSQTTTLIQNIPTNTSNNNNKNNLATAINSASISSNKSNQKYSKNSYTSANIHATNNYEIIHLKRITKSNVVTQQTANNMTAANVVDVATAVAFETKKPAITKAAVSTNPTAVKTPKNKELSKLHYGLQWNTILPQVNGYLNYEAKSQPATILIPEFWVSKKLTEKHEVALQLNPYSQYTLQSGNVLNIADYPITTVQGGGGTPVTVNYVRTRTLVKAMGVELTAKYTYHINNRFSIAAGIGNTWLNAAVVNDNVSIKNNAALKDSLYGIAKGFKDWNYLKDNFLVGRFEVLYNFKRVEVGIALLKPLGNIYSFSNNNSTPINGRLVIRWKIK